MRKGLLFMVFIFGCASAVAQNPIQKTYAVRDSIVIDTLSISPFDFKVSANQKQLDSTYYSVSFRKAVLYPTQKLKDSFPEVNITYYPLPDFLTTTYKLYDEKRIVKGNRNTDNYFDLINSQKNTITSPFNGLNTTGNISRAIVVGNNQNTVTQSELDLQISGNISPNVTLRASIQDANVPTQTGGFSQRLDEFDQIFIELQGPNWGIRAGDIDLVEANSFFGAFTKRVQGLRVEAGFGKEDRRANVSVAGALVRGVFARARLTAQEGNQGPYKINGPNGELFVLIVSGSEAVYVNGQLLQRGENFDYVIDYNAGELIFNPTFPITSEMRIIVEYQYTEQNFTRIVAHGKSNYSTEKWNINGMYFIESDLKNQPLQQSLNEEQVEALANAGDDESLMFVPSAVETEYSENRILYRKETINGEEVFVFSNNPQDTLFNVVFTEVGPNQGNYILTNENAITNIYQYVPPVAGVPQGNFEPIRQLIAPQNLEVASVNGSYTPTSKTSVNYELAISNNDKNLFSSLDDDNNSGMAGRFNVQQQVLATRDSLQVNVGVDVNYIDTNFTPIQRLFNVEFVRDWNIETAMGDQLLTDAYTTLNWKNNLSSTYRFQLLDFSENFTGNKHILRTRYDKERIQFSINTSLLNSESDLLETDFFRLNAQSTYSLKKYWIGAKIDLEDVSERNKLTDSLTANSQRFQDVEGFVGVGDSTKINVQVGYRYRVTDSIISGVLQRSSTSNDVYLKSRLLQSNSAQLNVFVNHRTIKFDRENVDDRTIINSRIQYNQNLFKQKITFRATYETNSGSVARQDFTYVQVEPGQGQYTWIDYNNNGIQELDEFELAQFQDQAEYVRVLLPNQIFVGVNRNRFSNQMSINLRSWEKENGFRKVLSHFFNQTAYSIDRQVERDGNEIQINPFSSGDNEELSLLSSFRNTLFFNRGRQRYTNSYTFISNTNRSLLSIGTQDNNLQSHQWDFLHKFGESWLLNTNLSYTENESNSENFDNRNFELVANEGRVKLSYLFSNEKRFDAFFEYKFQDNTLGEEELTQQVAGLSFTLINGSKYNINGDVSYIRNEFEGDSFSPVAFTMLEGLQPDDNFTWNLFLQRKITSFLDLNLTYAGRKSSGSNTIHTGSVQLRAYF